MAKVNYNRRSGVNLNKKVKVKIVDDVKRLREFEKQIARGFEIRVGILSKGGDEHPVRSGKRDPKKTVRRLTIAYLASIHEFGLGVPERSFIRGWYDAEKEASQLLIAQRIAWALKNKKKLIIGGKQVAVKLAASCQNRMVKGWAYPDISAETKKRKKSSTPLIDKGILKSAIVGEARQL